VLAPRAAVLLDSPPIYLPCRDPCPVLRRRVLSGSISLPNLSPSEFPPTLTRAITDTCPHMLDRPRLTITLPPSPRVSILNSSPQMLAILARPPREPSLAVFRFLPRRAIPNIPGPSILWFLRNSLVRDQQVWEPFDLLQSWGNLSPWVSNPEGYFRCSFWSTAPRDLPSHRFALHSQTRARYPTGS